MRVFLLFIALISLSFATYSQVDPINTAFIPSSIDSIQVSVWEMHTKEMSIPNQENEYERELKRIVLVGKDVNILITSFLDPNSYDQTRALQNHYNLVFELYDKGIISVRIDISTITGNIDLKNKLKKSYFKNNCSKQLNSVLLELLTKKNLIKLFDEIDLEGVKE